MADLTGKVAVVTGGTRGLGLAIAEVYADAGAAVVVASRSEGSVQRAVEQLEARGARASGLPVNVGDRTQVEALAQHARERYGQFDIWVNNAGISPPYGPTIHVPVEDVELTLHTNIMGTYYGTLAAMRHFLPRGTGKLINLTGRGARGPTPFQNAYASTKAWVKSFTLGLAEEYKESGVGVYLFSPGMVLTDMLTDVEVIEGHEERLSTFQTVLRMWANPPEVPAAKALWIAAEAQNGVAKPEVRVLTFPRLVGGALREGVRRVTGREGQAIDVEVHSVEPTFDESAGAGG